MCRGSGSSPSGFGFFSPREGTLRPGAVHADAPAVRTAPFSCPFGCCLAGGPGAGSGSIEGWCDDMRRPLGEQHEGQVRAQWLFPQRVTGPGLR